VRVGAMRAGALLPRLLPWLVRVLLVLSVLASLAAAGLFGFFGYLIVGAYSGGSSPTNIAPVLFPIAFLLLIGVVIPAVLVCVLLWLGFRAVTRRSGGRVRWRLR